MNTQLYKNFKRAILLVFLVFEIGYAVTPVDTLAQNAFPKRLLRKHVMSDFERSQKFFDRFDYRVPKSINDEWIEFSNRNFHTTNHMTSKYLGIPFDAWASYHPVKTFNTRNWLLLSCAFSDVRLKPHEILTEVGLYDGAKKRRPPKRKKRRRARRKRKRPVVNHGVSSQERVSNPFEPLLNDIARGIKLKPVPKFTYSRLTERDFNYIKHEAMHALATRAVITLQVKKEYLISLVHDLFNLFSGYEIFTQNIATIKIIKRYDDKVVKHYGTVLLHVRPLRSNEFHVILYRLIDALKKRYMLVTPTIALDVKPAYTRKITDLIYISGSDRQTKSLYKSKFLGKFTSTVQPDGLQNTVFTDDFAFVRGFEFDPTDASPSPAFTPLPEYPYEKGKRPGQRMGVSIEKLASSVVGLRSKLVELEAALMNLK